MALNTEGGFAAPPWDSYENGGRAAFDARMDIITAPTGSGGLNLRWLRLDMLGHNKPQSEWDNIAADCASRGIKILAVHTNWPNPDDVVSWVQTVLKYPAVRAVEIGNELNAGNLDPNYSTNSPPNHEASRGTPADFAPIMQKAFMAAMAIDPTIRVLIGALCSHNAPNSGDYTDGWGMRPERWMQQFVAAAQSYKVNAAGTAPGTARFPWHAASLHPYSDLANCQTDPSTDPYTGGVPGTQAIHSAMTAVGDPGNVWTTEFGWRKADPSTLTPSTGYAANAVTFFGNYLNWYHGQSYTGPYFHFTFDGPNLNDEAGEMGVIEPNNGTNLSTSTIVTRPLYGAFQNYGALLQPDTTPPTVSLATVGGQPAVAGMNVSGSNAQLVFNASDDRSTGAGIVIAVAIFNGPLLGAATYTSGNNYTFSFDSTKYANGTQVALVYRAGDEAGNLSGWASLTVTINNAPPATTPPKNTALPVITGNPMSGSTLTANVGTWSGSTPLSYVYQWVRVDALGNQQMIAGASQSTYAVTAADQGYSIRVAVWATNSAGTAAAMSASFGPIGGTPSALRASRMGFSAGSRLPTASATEQTNTFAFLKQAGATWMRFEARWDQIEPNAPSGGTHTYNWVALDALVNQAVANGLTNIIITAWCTPAWARDPASANDDPQYQPMWPPAASHNVDWGSFVGAISSRYRNKIVAIEIWKDANDYHSWRPGPEVGGSSSPVTSGMMSYASLVNNTLFFNKQADPVTRFITSGGAPILTTASYGSGDDGNYNNQYTGHLKTMRPDDFLADLYVGGAGGFDAVGLKPYSYPVDPAVGAPDMAMSMVQSVYNQLGLNNQAQKLIWALEVGAPTGEDGNRTSSTPSADTTTMTTAQQAQWVNDYHDAWFALPFTGPMLWYMPTDLSPTDYSTAANNFGLAWLNADGTVTPKPAWNVYKCNASLALFVVVAGQPKSYGIGYGLNPNGTETRLDLVQAMGADWVRLEAAWPYMEPNAPVNGVHSINFTGWLDGEINDAWQRGLKILLQINYAPVWASGSVVSGGSSVFSPPTAAHYADWQYFCTALIQRYGSKIAAWEIWNEPNGYFWLDPTLTTATPKADPNLYKTILQLAHDALKAVDSTAFVVTGGLAYVSTSTSGTMDMYDFIVGMYNAGAKSYFDAIGIHPYTGSVDPMTVPNNWQNPFYQAGNPAVSDGGRSQIAYYQVMVNNGDASKKIWATEQGYYTYPPGTSPIPTSLPNAVDEATQATFLVSALSNWTKYSFAGPIFTYDYRDKAPFTTNNPTPDNSYGVVHNDFSDKPARAAWQNWVQNHPPLSSIPASTGGIVQGPTGASSCAVPGQPLAAPQPAIAIRHYANRTMPVTLTAAATATDSIMQVTTLTQFPPAPFVVAVDRGLATEEMCLVTAATPVTIMVVRGWDGRPSFAHSSGAVVEHALGAKEFREWNFHYTNTTHDHHPQYVRKDIIQAKGDLLVFDGTRVTRLPIVGTTDLVLTADPTSSVGLSWLAAFPAGSVMWFAGATPPPGWLAASGGVVSRSTYATLFNAIGTTFGNGDGSGSTFTLPDLRGRAIVGAGAGPGLTQRNLSATGGEEAHVGSANEVAVHTHVQDPHNHIQNPHNHAPATPGQFITNAFPAAAGWALFTDANGNAQANGLNSANTTATNQSTTATNQNAGGGAAANVMQPYLTLTPCVKT